MPMRPPAAALAPPLAVFVLPVRVLLHAPTPASRSVAPATAATIFVLLRDIVSDPSSHHRTTRRCQERTYAPRRRLTYWSSDGTARRPDVDLRARGSICCCDELRG